MIEYKMIKFTLLNPSHLNQVMEILKSHRDVSNNFTRFGLNWSQEQVKKALTSDMGFGLFESNKESDQLMALILGRKISESTFEIDMTMTGFHNLKKGYMGRLFQESLAYLKTYYSKTHNNTHNALNEIWLEVHEENLAAITFYKKKGFVENTIRPKYYPDGKGALLMTLQCRS
jgi:ribosomal protein S18 acetylase RimI-like enzyme